MNKVHHTRPSAWKRNDILPPHLFYLPVCFMLRFPTAIISPEILEKKGFLLYIIQFN